MKAIDLLNLWMKYTNFNPKQTSFKIFTKSYEFNSSNRKIIEFYEKWDSSGIISLLYAKYSFINFMKSDKVTLYDLLSNQITDFEELKNMYNEFYSKDFLDMEDSLIKSLEYVCGKLTKNKLIGNFSKDELLLTANNVLENILYLNTDVFKVGQEMSPFNNFSTKILVYNSLAECLLNVEKFIDGIFLCYIKNENKPDGYFGFFIKNNGNLFSINERLPEKYIGQHQIMSNRNNRYSNEKAYDLFPYEIVNFEGEDSKGCATNHIIDDKKLEYENLDNISLMNIVIMLYLFNKKFTGKRLESNNLVYVNSLLKENIKYSLPNSSTDLIKYNNSDLIKYHDSLNISLSEEEFFNGELCHKFNTLENVNDYKKTGYFQNINQKMVEVFGKDFDFNSEIKNILQSDKTKYLLSNGDKTSTEITFNNEFVGTKESFELQTFYFLRKKLANHIMKKQLDSLNNFGGVEALKNWYKELILKNYQKIKSACIEIYKNPIKAEIEYNDNFCFRSEKRKMKYISYYNSDKDKDNMNLIFWVKNQINEIEKSKYKDLEDNKNCYHYFVFKIPSLNMLEEFFETKFPDFCLGYYESFMKPYVGNSILDVVDPIDSLTTILDHKPYRFSFDFVIGFSKHNFKNSL